MNIATAELTTPVAAWTSSHRQRAAPTVVLLGRIEAAEAVWRLRGRLLGVELQGVAAMTPRIEAQLLQERLRCALLNPSDPAGLELCQLLRASPVLRWLPVVALVDDPWSEEPGIAMSAGADDFVPATRLEELAEKLAAIGDGPAVQTPRRGRVLVADPDPRRRVRLGRPLQRLGLEVVFALELPLTHDRSFAMIVVHTSLLPEDPRPLLAAGGDPAPTWIICGSAPDLRDLSRSVGGVETVGFFDLGGDPTQLVFVANSLVAHEPVGRRGSKRLPYDRAVRVRAEVPDPTRAAPSREWWGFIYNISASGLFVRTLTPPPPGTRVQLEFQPPHGRGRVVVEATSIWRQPFCGTVGRLPGFGIKFDEPLPTADAAALKAGYDRLLGETGGLLR